MVIRSPITSPTLSGGEASYITEVDKGPASPSPIPITNASTTSTE